MRKFLMKCKCTLLILCIIFGITAIVPDISEKSPFVVTTEAKKKKKKKAKYSAKYFRRMGVIRWNGWRWTWYSQRVLPGRGLRIPSRHVDKHGYVCDKKGYICLASSKLRRGKVVKTPFGKKGKVYDSGCARNTLDVYTNWR